MGGRSESAREKGDAHFQQREEARDFTIPRKKRGGPTVGKSRVRKEKEKKRFSR